MLLYVPPPVGWIAMDASELREAQSRAAALLPPTEGGPADAQCGRVARTLLSPADAAIALAIDKSWLMRAAREGTIPCVRLGKHVRFDVDAIIGQCTNGPIRGRDTRIA
jgi:excisionase family DNA binding protein